MELLVNTDVLKIFNLFCSKLNKKESVFLLGTYYSENYIISNSMFKKNIVIAQQLLTYLKRNPFPRLEGNDTFEKLFYDDTDSVNCNCHPDYCIDDIEDIDIEKIKTILPELNCSVDRPIKNLEKKIEPSKIIIPEQIKIVQPQREEVISKSVKTELVFENHYKKTVANVFLHYLQKKKKNDKSIIQQDILECDSGNGFFTRLFLNSYKHVYVLDDKQKSNQLKSHPRYHKLSSFPETLLFDGIFSYDAVSHKRKEEIIQTMNLFESLLKDSGYLFLSFMYGNGHKVINNEYSTLLDESEFTTLAAKIKYLKIHKIWVSSYLVKGKVEKKRLNIILQKSKEQNEIKTYTDSMTIEELPKSIDIQKLVLVSQISSDKLKENEIEQTITITRDGRIWISRKFSDDSIPTEKKVVTIERESVAKLFFMIYRSVFLQKREKNTNNGNWNLTIISANDDVFEATGSFGTPVLFNGKDVCKLIRENIPAERLWIFDYIEK